MTRPAKFDYDCVYGSLKGTPFYGKCPDLKIGEFWYEHEGFTSDNPKRAFNNMMNHGLKQSNRIIIDRPGLTERYMRNSVINRLKLGANIEEVWIRETDGILTLLYKNGRPAIRPAPVDNESVVISYGIVGANITLYFQIQLFMKKFLHFSKNPTATSIF